MSPRRFEHAGPIQPHGEADRRREAQDDAEKTSSPVRGYTARRTTVDGVEGNDLQKNTRLGVTVALPVNRYTSVKLYGSTGVSTRTGSDFDAVGILVQYRWGGGL